MKKDIQRNKDGIYQKKKGKAIYFIREKILDSFIEEILVAITGMLIASDGKSICTYEPKTIYSFHGSRHILLITRPSLFIFINSTVRPIQQAGPPPKSYNPCCPYLDR